MKLCSICDKKIEGTWCKNCKRFVKTYDVSDGIHLNESHNPKNDANCTYHTTTRMSTGSTHRTVTTQTSGTARSTNSTTAGTRKKSKAGKIVAIIICIYVIFGVLGTLGPVIVGVIAENIFETSREDEVEISEDWFYSEADEDFYGSNMFSASFVMLQALEPVGEETVEDGGYTYEYTYYDPEDIKSWSVRCSGDHFDMVTSEFEQLLGKEFGASENWEFGEETYSEYNYLCKSGEYMWSYFETDVSYYVNDALLINIDCDTATKDIHVIFFGADTEVMEEEGYMEFYNKVLEELDPEYNGTTEELENEVARVTENSEGYEQLALSDNVYIYAGRDDYGRTILAYYPVYER